MFGIIKLFLVVSAIVNASKHTKYISLSNQKCKIQRTFIKYILMNSVQNFTTIYLQLN